MTKSATARRRTRERLEAFERLKPELEKKYKVTPRTKYHTTLIKISFASQTEKARYEVFPTTLKIIESYESTKTEYLDFKSFTRALLNL